MSNLPSLQSSGEMKRKLEVDVLTMKINLDQGANL